MRIVVRFLLILFAAAGAAILWMRATSTATATGLPSGFTDRDIMTALGGLIGVLVAWRVVGLVFPEPEAVLARRLRIGLATLLIAPAVLTAGARLVAGSLARANRDRAEVIGDCRQRGWATLRKTDEEGQLKGGGSPDSLITAKCDNGDPDDAFR